MRTLAWSEHFALGHGRIDREHRRLLELATQIEIQAEKTARIEDILPICRDFFRLLVAHCFYEEQLLRKLPRDRFGPHVDEHCRGHARLIRQAQEILTGRHGTGRRADPRGLSPSRPGGTHWLESRPDGYVAGLTSRLPGCSHRAWLHLLSSHCATFV